MIIVVAGPSGCGKSTLSTVLASRLECESIDGDSVHSKDNLVKMSSGIPLTDDDRWEWLQKLVELAANAANTSGKIVIACSALALRYRDFMRNISLANNQQITFVFLAPDQQELVRRVSLRNGHFMQANMIESQLQVMEVPCETEPSTIVFRSNSITPDQAADEALRFLEQPEVDQQVYP